jgi:hypothetical protein
LTEVKHNFNSTKLHIFFQTAKPKTPKTKDFADFETIIAYFESRPPIFAYFETPIADFESPPHPDYVPSPRQRQSHLPTDEMGKNENLPKLHLEFEFTLRKR